MSQNESPRNSNLWSFVPAGLGLLDEDFELPEEQNSPNENVEEVAIPAIPTTQKTQPRPQPQPKPQPQPQPQQHQTQTLSPTGNNVTPFLDPCSPTSPNDSSILNYNPPIYQPHSPILSNSRCFYPPPPTYMHHPYYNPHMFADPEYFSKLMAEEDKRRRNTAASARFRTKKKVREQALEKTARDMSTKAEMLENRVKELEREIKWLKNLLIEKDSRILDRQHSDNNKHKDSGNNDLGTSDQQHQR